MRRLPDSIITVAPRVASPSRGANAGDAWGLRPASATAGDRSSTAMLTFFLEFAVVLGAILIGIRRGGVALGLIGGLGVAVLTFGFHTPPSEPPITVMLIILA